MSDLEARIAEVHVAHLGHVFTGVGPDGSRWYDSCVCGVELFGEDNSPEHRMYPGVSYAESAHAAHISQMLAPVIQEAQADAWGDGALAAYQSMVHGDTSTNPYKEQR